jgi:hypothetical protein
MMKDEPIRGALHIISVMGKFVRQLINHSQQARNVLNNQRFFEFCVQ